MAHPGKKRSQQARPQAKRPRSALWLAVGAVAALAVLVCWLMWLSGRRAERAAHPGGLGSRASDGSVLESELQVFARYGGSPSCRECHEEEFDLWKNSNHALAERNVDPQRDRTAFEPARTFSHGKQSTAVSWANGAPQVTGVGLSGKPEAHAVGRVIGNDPLRQFLVAFPGGRWQTLEASYDPHTNQWFDVYGNEDRRPGEWGHWTGRGMNWNFMCASCHNTRLRRNYDETTDTYHTTMAEMSVGCEACHGPLKAHNEWQNKFGSSGKNDPTLTKLSKRQVLDNCGFCHARRTELTGDFKPGNDFFDQFDLTIVDHTERYYPDGQVRDEDYEYSSFLGSRMHLRGVYCLDCHNPHSMKTLLPGNWLCLRCHSGGDTNAPVINPATHSRHKVHGFDTNGVPVNTDLMAYRPREVKETGGECVNCHMPQTAYMQRHWRHDHGFTCPDPLLTKQFGIPNACNRCHADKDADWALKYCDEWYGAKMERATRQRARMIARAQRGDRQVRDDLLGWLRKEDSPYWQAVVVGMLGAWTDRPEVRAALVHALEHTNALVRTSAAGALEPALGTGQPEVVEALRRRLADPVRSVRLGAAGALGAALDADSRAGREFQHHLANNADEPNGQMQEGLYCFARNDLPAALRHFQKAVEWDPMSAPIRQELAVALSALNRPQEAVAQLREACRVAPRDAESHYKLGLALNELGDLRGAAHELETAVQLEPRHSAGWYNLGLAQSVLGESEAALESLSRAESIEPEDARSPYARATILARLGRKQEAAAAVRRALALNPAFGEAKELLQMLGD
jgi:tetratricopeptide (TPR) repeat protein